MCTTTMKEKPHCFLNRCDGGTYFCEEVASIYLSLEILKITV